VPLGDSLGRILACRSFRHALRRPLPVALDRRPRQQRGIIGRQRYSYLIAQIEALASGGSQRMKSRISLRKPFRIRLVEIIPLRYPFGISISPDLLSYECNQFPSAYD
jgi:hypothetical protein